MGPAIFEWLRLRVGIPTIKPDVHVLRFVKAYIKRNPKEDETVKALVSIATELRIRPHQLDSANWHLQAKVQV